MISDSILLKLAIITSIIGFFGLFFVNIENDEEYFEINIIESKQKSNGYLITFKINQSYQAYIETNLSNGKYLVIAQKGGNNFYYISGFKNINGSN